MSRATDAFSSLISDVPGVDTSCFIRRSLNELKTKDERQKEVTPRAAKQTPTTRPPPPPQPPTDFNFASMDLDALGKPSTTTAASQAAAPLEDLFEHIPGCQETHFPPEDKTKPLEASSKQDASEQETPFIPVEEMKGEAFATAPSDMQEENRDKGTEEVSFFCCEDEAGASAESGGDVDEAASIGLEQSPSAPAMLDGSEGNWAMTASESAARSSDLKQRFDKYRTSLNKKAGEFKKKGLRAMKHGLGAAQEWVDKYVEERKQTNTAVGQRREEERQIEQFLTEIEQLSHYRREQLMSELPADFFQKVVDYAEAKGRSIEHLFITGYTEASTGQTMAEAETEPSVDVTSEDPEQPPPSEEPEFLEVTGDESLEVEEEEEDFDLLGLSSTAPEQPVLSTVSYEAQPLATADDLAAFISGGGGFVAEDVKPSVPQTTPFYEEEDLMAFEGGASSNVKSDYGVMYQQLKNAGAHSEEEIRAILKQKRQQDKETKMAAALQAKVDREREVEETQELLHGLKEKHLERIVAWKEKHANNMRGLLTSLESVLWENSGWKSLTVADVLEPVQVKKAYMKANLIIHPDKVKQKGGSPEQVVLADMVFNVLKEGWQRFQA